MSVVSPTAAVTFLQTAEPSSLTTGMAVVFGIVAVALVLFVWEPVPIDITAIGVMVVLVALEPWTEVNLARGLSGFSSSATVAVLAMFILSEGIRRRDSSALSEKG